MNEKAQRIVQFLAEHEVSEADRVFWRDLFAKDTSGQAAEGLFEFLTSYPQKADWMRGMVEKKRRQCATMMKTRWWHWSRKKQSILRHYKVSNHLV